LDNDGKIKMLYNKWLRVQNGGSEDGMECSEFIQGKAIAIAYEKK
jgi:hypothetical protein